MPAAEPDEITHRGWMVEARERTGRSQEALGHLLGVSARTVTNWERGRTLPKIDIRRPLAKALGLTLNELNRQLGLPSAPKPAELNGNAFAVAREWISLLVRAELAANAIWTLGTHAIPALCQATGYAQAVELSGHREFSPEEVDDLVQRRRARAQALATAEFTALIADRLLDANKGGPEIMAEQMSHLLDLADRPNVTLLIIDTEHLSAAAAPFTLVAQAGDVADLVAEEGHSGPSYREGTETAADFVRLFNHLASLALDPESSRTAIARSADRFNAMAATLQRGTTT